MKTALEIITKIEEEQTLDKTQKVEEGKKYFEDMTDNMFEKSIREARIEQNMFIRANKMSEIGDFITQNGFEIYTDYCGGFFLRIASK